MLVYKLNAKSQYGSYPGSPEILAELKQKIIRLFPCYTRVLMVFLLSIDKGVFYMKVVHKAESQL